MALFKRRAGGQPLWSNGTIAFSVVLLAVGASAWLTFNPSTHHDKERRTPPLTEATGGAPAPAREWGGKSTGGPAITRAAASDLLPVTLHEDELHKFEQQASTTAIQTYAKQKGNIYFSRDNLAQELLARDESAVEHLGHLLQSPPVMNEPWMDTDDKVPQGIRERMAALDLLGLMSATDSGSKFGPEVRERASTVLLAHCQLPLPRSLSPKQRQVMVAEKYDAFVAMAHADPERAFSAYRSLPSSAQRAVIRPALMTALVEQGIARADVDAEFSRRVGRLPRDDSNETER